MPPPEAPARPVRAPVAGGARDRRIPPERVRNFCIIAHVDHGKSTLADRLIQRCGGVSDREFRDQLLDSMDLERERGITIKSNSVSLLHTHTDGKAYQLNLIDTPGHVDFSHEVRRSLMSCEGALLLVDAAQGVEAQTVANHFVAMEYDLAVVPVINKIDLPAADPERVREEIDEELGLDPFSAVLASAKRGDGVEEILAAIVERFPPPGGDPEAPLRALVFDAQYDQYRGVVLLLRVVDGTVRRGDRVRLMHGERDHAVEEVGLLRLRREPVGELPPGAVGYAICGIRAIRDIAIGDTLTSAERSAAAALPGYREALPVVFSSVYPISTDDYGELEAALDRLSLNDPALTFEREASTALGFGFRCGFLGLLHLDVVQERLQREHRLSLLISAPSVRYRIVTNGGEVHEVENPSLYPDPATIQRTEEPFIRASILVPERSVGAVMELLTERRMASNRMHFLSSRRVEVRAEMPLAEVLFDFHDRLKTVTRGYGSYDYELLDYRASDLVKVDILVNGDRVDALSQLVHRDKARPRALHICERLAETIPRHNFKIAVQGAIGGKIIARSNIRALRKDVTAKCYGGDISRKRKLLERQKEGKKRMKQVGMVQIPQTAFVAVLKSSPTA